MFLVFRMAFVVCGCLRGTYLTFKKDRSGAELIESGFWGGGCFMNAIWLLFGN